MSLVLFDLDNTLIDRAAPFRAWALRFVETRGLAAAEVRWLEAADEDGMTARAAFFEQVRSRYGIEESVGDLVDAYRDDFRRFVQRPAAETFAALEDLRRRGWRIGIVSNGSRSQEAKIAAAGLADAVDGWAISEVVGARKPEPAIFEAAAVACGCALDGAWVVGDNAAADIAGAKTCSLRSVWISRGRRWQLRVYEPDAVAPTVADAVALIIRDAS